jgi:polyisoprenoid-binding protein YceI
MRAVVLFFLLGASLSAQAVEYDRFVPEQSRIGFIYRQMNSPVEGAFRRFGARLRFDPKRPEAAMGEMTVEVASIDTGSPEGDEEARGRLWFDAARHPYARFVVESVRALGGDRFEVRGMLTIKGASRPLTLPVRVRPEGTRAVLEGATILRRADFRIGEGLWADFGTVANEVEVRVRLVLTASRP